MCLVELSWFVWFLFTWYAYCLPFCVLILVDSCFETLWLISVFGWFYWCCNYFVLFDCCVIVMIASCFVFVGIRVLLCFSLVYTLH